jgi:hypothetical protein
MAAWMIPAAIIGSSLFGSSAASKAANAQAAAADRATQLQREQFDRQVELQAPFRDVGVRALPELEAASRYTPFGMSEFQADPGYGFRLSEGQKALDRQAAARGGLISGGALKAAQRYGQEMGSQEYTNAFNRYQTERQARLNPLQSLAGMGQTSVAQLGQAGQTMATNVGEAGAAAAQARASGYMGGANALSQGLSSYMGYSQGQDRNALLRQSLANRQGALGFGSSNAYGNEDLGQYL